MKVLCILFSLGWLTNGLLAQGTLYPPERGGGADGVNGNEFLKGTSDTPKLEVRTHCSRNTPTSTVVELSIYVYQKDTAFKFSDIGPDDDKFVEYGTCFLIDAEDYEDNANVVKATDVTSCGNTADLAKVDAANPIDTGFKTRTFTTKISFTPTDNTYECGGYKDSFRAVFALTCKRNAGYDKAFDDVFIVSYDAVKEACVAKLMETGVRVSPAPIVEHEHSASVSFKAFRNLDFLNTQWPDGPQSKDGAHSGNIKEITNGAIELGEAIYFEICLVNPSVPSDTFNQFFPDGMGPIGVYVKKMTAKNDPTAGTPGLFPDTPVTVVENNCGKGVDPTEMIAKSDNSDGTAFRYVKDSTDPVKDWLRTPNCFRSRVTPAVSFARKIANAPAVTVYEAELEFCTSSDETRCFGNKKLNRDGYPACARKKREASDRSNSSSFDLSAFPRKVSLAIRVTLPGFDQKVEETCTEITILVSLSTVFSVLLFVVVIAAILMAYNLQSLTRANDVTLNSMMGIVNKGFYY